MAYQVVGKKSGTFTDRKTGEVVEFGKLYVNYPELNVEGLSCEAVSLKPDALQNIKVGEQVRLDRNQYGKVISVEVVKQ